MWDRSTRLRRWRGKASTFTCPCGAPAAEWAYDHADPDELIGEKNGRPVPYSLYLDHYRPLCQSCHKRLDQRADRERDGKGRWVQ